MPFSGFEMYLYDSLASKKIIINPGRLLFRINSARNGTDRSIDGNIMNSAPYLSASAPMMGPDMNVGADAATGQRAWQNVSRGCPLFRLKGKEYAYVYVHLR